MCFLNWSTMIHPEETSAVSLSQIFQVNCTYQGGFSQGTFLYFDILKMPFSVDFRELHVKESRKIGPCNIGPQKIGPLKKFSAKNGTNPRTFGCREEMYILFEGLIQVLI